MKNWAKVMIEDWDSRAREDPLHHLYRKANHSIEAFFQEGKHHAIALTFPFLQSFDFDPLGKRILDIGCGMGRLFPGFKELGFAEIWGIDISREMLERGRMMCPVSEANFALGDGGTLDGLDSKYFDYCFCYNVFPCVPDARIVLGYLDEIDRVLRPGGAFQLHFRRNYRWKARVLRILPASIRSPVRSSYHMLASRRTGGLPNRSIEALYAPGSLETWLGASVSPRQVISRLARLGLTNLKISTDPMDNSDGSTFWAAGQKPAAGRVT